eukprot:93806-Chlamydomonas_euryale.AAC.1
MPAFDMLLKSPKSSLHRPAMQQSRRHTRQGRCAGVGGSSPVHQTLGPPVEVSRTLVTVMSGRPQNSARYSSVDTP